MKNRMIFLHQHILPYSVARDWKMNRIRRSVPQQLLLAGIRWYRRYLSPMKNYKCPYIPTCSEYGLEAVEKYGAFKGGFLALWRILRCNPLSHGGYDPVP